MKYKDYLILPVFIMSLLFASCKLLSGSDGLDSAMVPDA